MDLITKAPWVIVLMIENLFMITQRWLLPEVGEMLKIKALLNSPKKKTSLTWVISPSKTLVNLISISRANLERIKKSIRLISLTKSIDLKILRLKEVVASTHSRPELINYQHHKSQKDQLNNLLIIELVKWTHQ